MYPLITRIGKPKDFNRFIIQARACLTHNAYEELGKIQCPTLVIGGDRDKVVGISTSEEMAEAIPGSRLVVYPNLGHGAFVETKDFDQETLKFLS
jgi:pimeloyl-ACP methyl ester carboxylesterase